ncbi:MAG: TRAP transporter substrate-binding protein DctP [Candidatus Calescibacterium sp.]|nr:TRAP transporter substrate-binding protein DctP [Candidatus Calescibacterium sp.]MCX7733245.1 TRAP transporter substrate-binding protein DctP [bacterium]
MLRFSFVRAIPCIVISFFLISPTYSQDIWRCGTIAPPGSEYEKVINRVIKEVKKIIDVEVKVYYANSFGDEIDVARELKAGRLDCGVLTGNGLGYISSYSRAIDLPFLIKSRAEWERIQPRLTAILSNAMRNEGWELLGLFGIGFVHFLSKYPIESLQSFSGRTFWVWKTDLIQIESYNILKMFGVKPFEISVLEVPNFYSSLDIVWGPKYAFIAFGWYRHFKYIVYPPIFYFTGGLVASSEKMKKYHPDQVARVREMFEKEMKNVTNELEQLNERSLDVLLKSGIKKVELKDADKLENSFKSNMYESLKKHIPSWLIVSVIEEVLKARDNK